MKKFEVVRDFKGSRDGCTVRSFKKGEIVKDYELGDDLIQVAFDEKWIKPVSEKPARSTRGGKK